MCKPRVSFDQKLLDEARRGMLSLRSVVDMISNPETSDVDSTSGNEANEENNDVDVEEKNTSEQYDKSLLKKTASDTKRKTSEAGCSSEQNNTLPVESENTKRMRMNTVSSTDNDLSDYKPTHLEFLECMLNESPESSDFDDDLVDDEIDDDSDTAYEATYRYKYRFLSNRKENEMSKLLKDKINLLPLPAMLKMFLNYNKDD